MAESVASLVERRLRETYIYPDRFVRCPYCQAVTKDEPHTEFCIAGNVRVLLAELDRLREAASRLSSPEGTRVKCDGNHAGPRCADPECWNDTASPADTSGPANELIRLGERAALWFADGERTDELLDEATAIKCIDGALGALEGLSAEKPNERLAEKPNNGVSAATPAPIFYQCGNCGVDKDVMFDPVDRSIEDGAVICRTCFREASRVSAAERPAQTCATCNNYEPKLRGGFCLEWGARDVPSEGFCYKHAPRSVVAPEKE